MNSDEIKKHFEAAGDLKDWLPGGKLGSASSEIERYLQRTETYKLPEIRIPKMPTAEEVNHYASAMMLVERMHARYESWLKELPADGQPVILAIANGAVIRVSNMRAESHNAVAITGTMGDPAVDCMLLVHQSSLQLLCYVEKLVPPEVRKPIGFHWED